MKKYFKILFLLLLLTIGIGYSSWVGVTGEASLSFEATDSSTAVCYFRNDTEGTRYFTDLTACLDVCSSNSYADSIYVIPGTNPSIKSNVTINSGDALYLPYDGEICEDASRTTFGDFSDKSPSTKRKSKVSLLENVQLTNNGTIFVGGAIGNYGQAPTGLTSGNYAEITFYSNSKLINNGTLTCYGYMKEETKDNGSFVDNYGTLNLPAVIYDYRGGSYSSYAVVGINLLRGWKAMPFNVFDFPNNQIKTQINFNSYVNGTINVTANDKVTISSALIIGPASSTSLIRLNSGKLIYKYDCPLGYSYDDFSKTIADDKINKTYFYIDGDISLSYMKVDAGLSINTSEFHLPFSYKFHFILQSGKISISNKVKFLAGSELIVSNKGTLDVNAETVFYQNYVPAIITGRGDDYPRCNMSSTLINNGTVNINSSFGGIIKTTSNGAILNTNNSFSNSVTTTNALTGEKGGAVGTSEDHSETAYYTLIDSSTYDPTSDTNMRYIKNSTTLYSDQIAKNITAKSYEIYEKNDYGWLLSSNNNITYGIRYNLGSDTASNVSNPTEFSITQSSYSITPFTNSNSSLALNGIFFSSDYSPSSQLGKDASGNYIFVTSTALNYLNGNNFITLYVNWVESSAQATLKIYLYNANQELYEASIFDNLIISNEYALSDYTNKLDSSRSSLTVDRQYRIDYTLTGWSLITNSGSSITVNSNGKFVVPQLEEGDFIKLIPQYSEKKLYCVSITNGWDLILHSPSIWITKYGDSNTTYLEVKENAGTQTTYLENNTEFDVWVDKTGVSKTIKITYSDGSTKESSGKNKRKAFEGVKIKDGPIKIETL